MSKVEIKKSWFFSAGDKYNWTKDGLDVKGIGVTMDNLKKNGHIVIKVEDEQYYLLSEIALKFIEKYNSTFDAKGVELGIISKSLLQRIGL